MYCGTRSNSFSLSLSSFGLILRRMGEREICKWASQRLLFLKKTDMGEIQKETSQLSGEGKGLSLAMIKLNLLTDITGVGNMRPEGCRIRAGGEDEHVPTTMVGRESSDSPSCQKEKTYLGASRKHSDHLCCSDCNADSSL